MDSTSSSPGHRRKFFLHIGSDKAGSTALQLHLVANMHILAEHRIFVPKYGKARVTGHHGLLFGDLTDDRLDEVSREVDQLPEEDSILMSWEGIHFLNAATLNRFRKRFSNCDFHIIYYVREQADVIQTGFLQQIKGTELNAGDVYKKINYKLRFRNYYRTVKKFQRCFPGCEIDVVLYDRNDFPERNIVYDFFSRIIDKVRLEDIVVYDTLINSSLSLDEVEVLAFLEQQYPELCRSECAEKKSRIIDLLLAGVLKTKEKKSSYFMCQQQVEKCRAFYRKSNRELIEKYNVSEKLISEQKPAWNGSNAQTVPKFDSLNWPSDEISKLLELAELPYIDGGARKRFSTTLSSLLAEGWSSFDEGENWTVNQRAVISGRLRFQSTTPLIKSLRFNFRGNYAPHIKRSSSLFINGEHIGDVDLRYHSFEYPLEKIGSPYAITIEIVHQESIRPCDIYPGLTDKRSVSFKLKNFNCILSKGGIKPV